MRMFFFDFDGTLSSLVEDRRAAKLNPSARELLRFLAATSDCIVAVLSSRPLDDLVKRVPVSGVFLGGCSGVEWRLPAGDRLAPPKMLRQQLLQVRQIHLQRIGELVSLAGAELEEKQWSVAVHTRLLSTSVKQMLGICLTRWCAMNGLRLYRGPEVLELHFLPQIHKGYGVQELCGYVGFDPGKDRLYYAGDDENDAVAMKWVLEQGGIVFSIGDVPLVDGAYPLDGPESLAQAVKLVVGY